MDAKNLALTVLGKTLQSRGYRFVAVTPATHCRVLDRPLPASTLESIFGWNWPFDRDALDPEIFDLLEDAEALEGESGRYKSKVRFATVDDLIFAHSGFPTGEPDAVLFGPDTYRFVRLLRASLAGVASGGPLRLVDIGSGSGAGGIVAARLLGKHTDIVLGDTNRTALAFSAVNAVADLRQRRSPRRHRPHSHQRRMNSGALARGFGESNLMVLSRLGPEAAEHYALN
jgi:hypothetical protein